MTEDVNQDVNELFDDGDGNKSYVSQHQKVVFNEKNYLNTRLGDNEQKRTLNIRIILTEDIDGKKKFAIPVNVHSLKLSLNQNKQSKVGKSGYKSFICLNDKHIVTDSDNGCPLCKKKNEIFAEANEITDANEKKAVCKKAYGYDTKTSYIVRCIERGHEDEGIKFWRFNKHDDGSGPFDVIKELCINYYNAGINIFDYKNGYDLIITLTKSSNKKNPNAPDKTAIKIMTDVISRPLGSDEQIKGWVNDTKDWRDMYRAKSYDYLAIIADDKTPVFNQELNKWVPWVDEDEKKKAEYEAVQELKKNTETINPVQATNAVEDEEELPF